MSAEPAIMPDSKATAPSGGLAFEPVATCGLAAWSRPESLAFLESLAILPLGDTEVLHTAHYAPIAIAIDAAGPRVVAIVHPRLLLTKILNAAGRWSPPYVPMALRCLPFRAGTDGPEIARALLTEGGTSLPFQDENGKPSPDFALVLELLARVERGGSRLATAAKFLILADVLSPLHPLQGRDELRLYIVNSDKLRAMPPRLAAALTADNNLPFELAAASIFSLRHLDRRQIGDILPPSPRETAQQVQSPGSDGIDDAIDQPVAMDDSPLFSIEDYLESADNPA